MQSLNPEFTNDQINYFKLENNDLLLEEEDLPFEEDLFEERLDFEDIPFDNNSDLQDLSLVNLTKDCDYRQNHKNRQIRILDFLKNSNSGQDKTLTLLWPVYLWRVAAPTTTESKVNFLVLACIRLAEAGVTVISDQARYLALSKDLIANVIKEAQSNKYLDNNHRITNLGKDLLASEGVENKMNTQYGWILQEAVLGDVLPFFYSGKLDEVTVSPKKEIRLSIPKLFPSPEKPPESSIIFQRVKNYYKLDKERQDFRDYLSIQTFNYCSSEDALRNIEIDSIGFSVEKEDLPIDKTTHQGVRVLSKRPDQYNLTVRFRLEGTADGAFSLMCPFGLPDAMRWMRLFYFAANQSQEVKQVLENLQSQSREIWKQKQPPDLDFTELSRQAYSRLIYEIGKPLDSPYQSTWTELEKMMQSKILLEFGFDEADSTITRCQKVLEQLILTLIKAEPVSKEVISLYNGKGELARCITDTLTACGATSIPPCLTSFSIREIEKIIMGASYRSLLLYVSIFVFIASRKGKTWQILKYVLRENPNFLDEIYKVANTRNKFGAHAGGDLIMSNGYISTQAHDLVDIVCKNVRLLTSL